MLVCFSCCGVFVSEIEKNIVPYVEVEMIKESEESEPRENCHNGGVPSILGNSTSNHIEKTAPGSREYLLQPRNGGDPSRWKDNYVPCTELQTVLCDRQQRQCRDAMHSKKKESRSKPVSIAVHNFLLYEASTRLFARLCEDNEASLICGFTHIKTSTIS